MRTTNVLEEHVFVWRAATDSNREPTALEAGTLPIELATHDVFSGISGGNRTPI